MASRNPIKLKFKLRREEEYLPAATAASSQEAIEIPPSSSPSSSSSSSSSDSDDEIIQAHFNSKQLVLYDPANANGNAVAQVHDNAIQQYQHGPVSFPYRRSFQQHHPSRVSPTVPYPFNHPPRVLPSVGVFTVQCASCFKWRIVPTKEKYEEIREHILERPFYCELAREWQPCVSCDDPADIDQDGSRLWAIDKPNIAQPPPGWQRLVRIRGEGGTRFADVYYESPTGKKLRSSVEIQKYLLQHPEYLHQGVTMSQFSFLTPKPLQENYVRKKTRNYEKKRPAHLMADEEVNPIAWVGPDDSPDLQLRTPAHPLPLLKAPRFDPFIRPTKKRSTKTPSKSYLANQHSSTEWSQS